MPEFVKAIGAARFGVMAGIAAALLFLITTRKSGRSFFLISAVVFAATLAVWWDIDKPPLVTWLLPRADQK